MTDGGHNDDKPMLPSQSNDTLFDADIDDDGIKIDLDDADIDLCMTSDDLNMDDDVDVEDVIATPPSRDSDEQLQSMHETTTVKLEVHVPQVPVVEERKEMEVIDLTGVDDDDVPMAVEAVEDSIPKIDSAKVHVIESNDSEDDSEDESVHVVSPDDLKTPFIPPSVVMEPSKPEESPWQDEALAVISECFHLEFHSIKALCSRMAASSFRTINKIDFGALAQVNVHFAGVYGNREPLAKLLLQLKAITHETYENLLDPVKNAETSWLKIGLFLCKLTKTQFCFLSQRDVDLINWSLDAPDPSKPVEASASDSEASDADDMFFEYSLQTRHPVASGTYFSVLTSEFIKEERKRPLTPLTTREAGLLVMEKVLVNLFKGNRVILSDKLDDGDIEEMVKMAMSKEEADAILEPLVKCRLEFSRIVEERVDEMKEQQRTLGEKKLEAFLSQFSAYLKMTFPKLEAFAEDKGKLLAELVADQEGHLHDPVRNATAAAPPRLELSTDSMPLFVDVDVMVEDSKPVPPAPPRTTSLDSKPGDHPVFERDCSEVNSSTWRDAKRRLFFCKEFGAFLSEGKEVSSVAVARMIGDLYLDEARSLKDLHEKCFESYSLHGQEGKDDLPKAKSRNLLMRFINFISDITSNGVKIDFRMRSFIKDRAAKAAEKTSDTVFFDAILEYVAVARKAALIDASEESSAALEICTEVAQRFSLIYQEARENLKRKFKQDLRRNTTDEIEAARKKVVQQVLAASDKAVKATRSIGNREAFIEGFTQITRTRSYAWGSMSSHDRTFKLQYQLETIQPPKICADETFVPTPRVRGNGKEAAATWFEVDPVEMEVVRVFELMNRSFLVFVREVGTGATLAYYGAGVREVGVAGARPWKKYARPITHIALDEEKGLLAFFDKETALLNIMCFDEAFRELFTNYAKIEIARWYNDDIPDIVDMVFIPGSEEICFVERSGRVRIYSLVTTDFKPAQETSRQLRSSRIGRECRRTL
ncbi:hypothetical protein HDU96_006298 [Phlyctochytrium bullatum]|nr:hypothetical protein HDU96_006298 [Phlyctochytrium bullatum]